MKQDKITIDLINHPMKHSWINALYAVPTIGSKGEYSDVLVWNSTQACIGYYNLTFEKWCVYTEQGIEDEPNATHWQPIIPPED
jgi:hypothetical protein